MSKLDELIKEYCPDGVKYLELNVAFDQFSGMGGVTNKWAEEGNCRFIDYMNAYKHIAIDVTDLPFATVKKLDQIVLKQGDVLFTSASETPDECAISSVIEDKIQDGIFLDDHLFGLRIKPEYKTIISPPYLKYAFRSEGFRSQMKKAVRGVTRFYVSKPDFMKLTIPVPPVEVQREIVRILDNFTELTAKLTAELTAELTARQKQYEYYHSKLLSFGIDTPIYKLRELVDFRNGKGHEKDIVDNGKYTVVNSKFISTNGQVKKYSNKQLCPLFVNDILMVMSDLPSGKALAKCFLVEKDDKYSLNQRIGAFHVKLDCISTKFLLHVLNRNTQLLRFDNGVDQTNLRKDDILDISIPVPPRSLQEKTVLTLDTFEAMCNDLRIGIPAEIEARQKQYEYYRDKLLTFKELKA